MPLHLGGHQLQAIRQAAALRESVARKRLLAHRQNIFAAHLQRRYAKLRSQHIHLALHCKAALRDAKAAERTARHVVGVHRVGIHAHVGHFVGAGGMRGGAQHHVIAQAGVRTAIAIDLGCVRHKCAILLCAGLKLDDGRVPLGMNPQ